MSDSENYGDFGASGEGGKCMPAQASSCKPGSFIVIKDRPCKVRTMSTAKTGKHGSAKCNITAIDIFNNRKYEAMAPSTSTVMVPIVTRRDYTLIDISDDDYVSYLTEDGDILEDLKVPEGEVGDKLRELFAEGKELIITVLSAMDESMICDVKSSN